MPIGNKQDSISLEQLQEKKDQIFSELNSLKKEIDPEDKKEKQEALMQSVKEAKNSATLLLEAEKDTIKKQKLEELNRELENYSYELNSLNNEIDGTNKQENEVAIEDNTKKTEKETEKTGEEKLDKEEKGIWQKTKDFTKEQRNCVFDGEKWKEEPGKNLARGLGFSATGVGLGFLAYKGIKALFGKKEKKDKKSESQSGEKKTSRWKKALARGGGILGGTWLGRGFITGKWDLFGWNPFSQSKTDGPETIPGSGIESSTKAYESLKQEIKEPYEKSAMAVNEYQTNIMGEGGSDQVEDMLGDSEFDKGKQGLIPFMLSNRYQNLNKMLGETSFYYEVLGTEGNVIFDKLKDWTLEQAKKILLVPLAGLLDSATFHLLDTAKSTGEFIDTLKTVPNAEEITRTIFRKSISVMSYYQSRKRLLETKLAEDILAKKDPTFESLSSEEKAEAIQDKLSDEEWYATNIQSEVDKFMEMNLKDATEYLSKKELLNGEVDMLVQTALDKVEKRRKDLLDIDDEDDSSNILDLKSELTNGKLSEKAQKKLENICEDFEEELYTNGKESWYMKYLPMFHILGASEQVLHQIQQTGDYDRIAKIYNEQVQGILKKSQDGKLEESDLDALEVIINDYYKFQKSLVASEVNISQSIDENGNIVMRRGRSIWAGGQNIYSGVQMLIDKKASNWEGAGLIAGGILSVDALTFGVAGKRVFGFSPFWALNKKVVFPIAKQGLRLTAKSLGKLTNKTVRTHLPSLYPAKFYNKDTFRIAVGRGEISLERAAKIAKKKGFTLGSISGNGALVETPEQVIQYIFGTDVNEAKRIAKVVEQYGDNPKIYKQLFPEYYQKMYNSRRKPSDWLKLNNTQVKFNLNTQNLDKLENIAKRINDLPEGVEKTVMKSMMGSIKSVDQAEYFATMGVGEDMAKFIKEGKGLTAKKYGKYLAKYAGKVDANDMRAFENFIIDAHKSNKITGKPGRFIRNGMKNFDKIKNTGFNIDKVESLKLNANKREKIAEGTKANVSKMTESLGKMTKNPKFKPFHKGIQKQITALNEYRKTITPNGMKALKNIDIFGNAKFAKLSGEGMHELGRLSHMLRDVDMGKDILTAIKKTKNLDELRTILESKGIKHADISDDILNYLVKTKNTKKIKDIVNYGAEFKAIQGFQKLIKNPAMKYVGRLAGKGLIGLDALFVGYNFTSQLSEAQKIKMTNMERGEWKENQAYFELGTGSLGAVAGACMFIPGAGWIAGGVIVASMAAMEIGEKYYKDIEKFKQNQADFLAKGIAATKQELTTIDSWDQGLSHTWIDAINLGGSKTKKEIGTPKTKAEALKALIKMEELQKNPLAGADMNAPEILKDDTLLQAVKKAKQEVEKQVDLRFKYFEEKYLKPKRFLIDKSKYSSHAALSTLEQELEASSIVIIMEQDSEYTGEKNPEKYREIYLQKLKEGNESNFNKLEKLFQENQISLFEMYAQLPYYKNMMTQYGSTDIEKLQDAATFFEKYMYYKMLGKGMDKRPSIDFNPDEIDYNPIHNFLSHFALIPTVLDTTEVNSFNNALSDEIVLNNYNVSGILGQDILYECAKLFSYEGKNNLEELKNFFNESKKEVYGIYFDGKNWLINENNGRDDKFANDSDLDSLSAIENMKKYINANTYGSFLDGRMFTESDEVNKELGSKIMQIIDKNLKIRNGSEKIKSGILEYIKKHAVNGKYIILPSYLVIKGKKAGLSNLGAFVYGYEGNNLIKKPLISGVTSAI